ncbi:MAG: phosphopantetheine-binding protein [Oligoflexia bacterium]|nr:phosphopantetheine-binding protein [Oligoflexia bacterium]
MKERIKKCLLSVGLPSVPENDDEALADYGFDSLLIVLSISALENEFSIKIPGNKVDEESFLSILAIEKLIISLGAK